VRLAETLLLLGLVVVPCRAAEAPGLHGEWSVVAAVAVPAVDEAALKTQGESEDEETAKQAKRTLRRLRAIARLGEDLVERRTVYRFAEDGGYRLRWHGEEREAGTWTQEGMLLTLQRPDGPAAVWQATIDEAGVLALRPVDGDYALHLVLERALRTPGR